MLAVQVIAKSSFVAMQILLEDYEAVRKQREVSGMAASDDKELLLLESMSDLRRYLKDKVKRAAADTAAAATAQQRPIHINE